MLKSQGKGRAWCLVLFFAAFMFVMTLNLIVFPGCALDTIERYGVGQVAITTLASVTSCVGIFTGIVLGPLVDKMGARKVIAICLLIGAICFIIRPLTSSYPAVIALTFLGSFFTGVCQVSSGKVLDTWFTKDKISVVMALQIGAAGIGSALAFALGAALGLTKCLWLIAIIFVILWVWWMVAGGYGPVNVEAVQPPKGAMKMVYKNKDVWMLAIAYGMTVTASLTINTYMINAFVGKGLQPAQAALMGTVLNLSLLIGSYVGAAIMAAWKRYNACTILYFAGGAIFYLLAWFTPLGANTWIFMIIGALLFANSIAVCVGRVPLLPMTGKLPPEAVGSATGALETVKGVISLVLPIAIASAFGLKFNMIFVSFAVMCVIGLLCGGVFIPELGPKGKIMKEAMANGDAPAAPEAPEE